MRTPPGRRHRTSQHNVTASRRQLHFPAAPRGTMDTNRLLAGYSQGDLPTLYFNYILGSDNDGSLTQMTDSARVMVATDNGRPGAGAGDQQRDERSGLPANGDELPIAITLESRTPRMISRPVRVELQPATGAATATIRPRGGQAGRICRTKPDRPTSKDALDFRHVGTAVTDTGTGNAQKRSARRSDGSGIADKKTRPEE